MKKSVKKAAKKQVKTEKALNKELAKVEKAFATGLRAGNRACTTCNLSA